MLRGEGAAAIGGAGLVQHRRSLRRRLAQVQRVEPVLPARDGGPGAPARDRRRCRRRGRADHRIVAPTAFPQRVDDLHVLVGQVVAIVMHHLGVETHGARGAVQIAGDDVPADAPVGQVVQRGHAAGEQERRLVGKVAGDAEAEMRGGVRHRRHQQQRIDQRHLHRAAQGRRRGDRS